MNTLKVLLVVLVVIMFIIFLGTSAYSKQKVWVAGTNGKKCYDEFKYHKNIKYLNYFDSEEECSQFINR